jgi:hypothetical protein
MWHCKSCGEVAQLLVCNKLDDNLIEIICHCDNCHKDFTIIITKNELIKYLQTKAACA